MAIRLQHFTENCGVYFIVLNDQHTKPRSNFRKLRSGGCFKVGLRPLELEPHFKCTSDVGFTLNLNGSAKGVHRATYDPKSQSCSTYVAIIGDRSSNKIIKDARFQIIIHALASITDMNGKIRETIGNIFSLQSNRNPAMLGKFQGIPDQIHQDMLQRARI